MRYKALMLQRLDLIEGLVKRIKVAVVNGDRKKYEETVDHLEDQLGEYRSMLNNERDDFE